MPEATAPTVTALEAKMLHAIAHNDHSTGDPTDPVWVFSAIDASGFEADVAGGLLTSLQNKGLAQVQPYDDDRTVHLTAAGVKALEPAPRQTDLAKLDQARNQLATFEGKVAQNIADLLQAADFERNPSAAAALWLLTGRLHLEDDVSRRYNDR